MTNRWTAMLAFTVIFIAGGACGWVVALRSIPPPASRPLVRPENFGTQLMMRWVRFNQLGLSPVQKETIRPIINDTAEKLRRLRREDGHNAQLLIEQMQDAVAAELTTEQRNRFDVMIQQQRQRMNRFAQQQQWQRMEQQQRRGQGP